MGHLERMGREVYRGFVGKLEGKRLHGNPGVDGRIILRWIFRKWDRGQDRSDSGQGHL